MADAPVVKQPNRPLAIITLLVTVIGAAGFTGYGIWLLFAEKRIPGFGYLSLGLVWFLFFSWRVRATLRPWPIE